MVCVCLVQMTGSRSDDMIIDIPTLAVVMIGIKLGFDIHYMVPV